MCMCPVLMPACLQDVYKVCKKVFAALPLAAVIGGQTLVLHGGT